MQHNEEATIAQSQAQLIFCAVCCRPWLPSAHERALHARAHQARPCVRGEKRVQGKLNCFSVMNRTSLVLFRDTLRPGSPPTVTMPRRM